LVLGAACGNWSLELKIGEGGYGEVFRGEWEHQAVAIKRIRYIFQSFQFRIIYSG
jgi:hypothetical protein